MARAATAVAIAIPDDFFHQGALTADAKQAMLRRFYHSPMLLTVAGAVDPTVQARYFINGTGVMALTLAAPTVGDDDNTEIEFVSENASAHTVTCPAGVLQDGSSAAHTKGTFAAVKGASLQLVARNGKWNVLASNGITFS